MSHAADGRQHAELMDAVYRHQRHVYDATRRFYLLGRDGLIVDLAPPEGENVLEIGCGTGRNLAHAARLYPRAHFFGIDISEQMLASARSRIERDMTGDQIQVARADAAEFDPHRLFGVDRFERLFFSYTLSMIPRWREALELAATLLAQGGSLHVVDFGDLAGLPSIAGAGLRAWLRRFHVEPRDGLPEALATLAARHGADFNGGPIFRGYAWTGTMRLS
jgi:S-adenosylmethionine-diacylgycerolhomoserine-N-methlytransferase